MGLTAELNANLNAGPIGATLLGNLQAPTQQLNGITPPASAGQIQNLARPLGDINLGGIQSSVTALVERAGQTLGSLPVAAQLLGPLGDTVELVEQLTRQDLGASLRSLADRLSAELNSPDRGSLFAVLIRISEILGSASETRPLLDLLKRLLGSSGIRIPSPLPIAEPLQAVDGAVRASGGMIAIETLLADAEQISERLSVTLDPASLRAQISALESLAGDGAVNFVNTVAGDDSTGAGISVRLAVTVAAQLETVRENLAAAMGLGEATLVYLDIDKLRAELVAASAVLRSADLAPLRRQLTSLASFLQPVTSLNIGGAPARTLEQWIAQVEAKMAQLAAAIASFDLTQFTRPVTNGINTVTGFITRAADLLASVIVSFQAAMDQVRAFVTALPLDQIADAIRTFLAPIAQAIQAIRDFLAGVEQALNTAAGTATTALNHVDGFLNQFQNRVNQLFAAARQAVESVNLDHVVGVIQDNIRAFVDTLAKAQMKPYFDTAVSAIGTTADVIGAVRFELLPESMKADVDNAVRPIKETDADAVKAQIEFLLQIGPGGKFQLSGDLEHAIAELQNKYKQLIQMVKDHNPRKALAEVDNKLKEVAARIRQIEPGLTLAPVQQALDQVKQALDHIDLNSLLQAVRDVFQQILDAIDRYSPAKLIEPFERRLDQARQRLLEQIGIDNWAAALDELRARADALLAQADPARFEPPLERVLTELSDTLRSFPQLPAAGGLGTLIGGLLQHTGLRMSHTSFEEVLRWIGSESGTAACNGRTERIAAALGRARDAVRDVDIAALSTAAIQRIATFREALQRLIGRLGAESPHRVPLTAVVGRLDADAVFGPLAGNRARYLATLERAASAAADLRATGFSEVDVKAHEMADALSPLEPLRALLRNLVRTFGLGDPAEGLAGVFRSVLAVLTPQRLVRLFSPLFTALRDRLNALIGSVIDPVKNGIAEIKRLINAIDLTPVKQAMTGVVNEVKTQVMRLHPDTLLRQPLNAFQALKDQIVNHDPLQTVITILNNLKALIARILEKLKLEKLLESPLAIYDHIVAQLDKLNVNGLLTPVFDQLDQIAQQVDTGLTDTVAAFKRLQAALPGGSGGSSVSVSLSAGAG